MKVRATRDGHYGGYERIGPFSTDTGDFFGEIFEINEKPYPKVDADGKPLFVLDGDGKKVIGKDGKPQLVMMSDFADADTDRNFGWMSRYHADGNMITEQDPITWPRPPFELPIQYREIKRIPSGANIEQLRAGAGKAPIMI